MAHPHPYQWERVFARVDPGTPPSTITNREGGMADDDQLSGSNVEKDPSDWVTGDEPMTGAQKSYLKTLTDQAGEEFDESLNKADASKRIDELQEQTGRGADGSNA